MPKKVPITASELAALWITYQEKTMVLRIFEYFLAKADDVKAKNILSNFYSELTRCVKKFEDIFTREETVIPVGFTEEDVNVGAPKLYDNGFDIMFARLLSEIGMTMHTLNITMTYREDITTLFKDLTAMTHNSYKECTQYLLQNGLMARSPYVTMPKTVEFVKDWSYVSSGLFNKKRVLNAIEVSHLYHAIESNVIGLNMITGFAQCAHNTEVRKYFNRGAELAKSIVEDVHAILLDSEIQVPVTAGGTVTRSTAAPFSDKLMLYCTSLFSSFSIGGNSLGTAFSMRNDLTAKAGIIMKDTYEYAYNGAKLMVHNGWLEEPPQMEDRKVLSRV